MHLHHNDWTPIDWNFWAVVLLGGGYLIVEFIFHVLLKYPWPD